MSSERLNEPGPGGWPPLAPGSRRLAQRRDRVYRAAIDLFVEKGFDETTMDEIAERADVARASVFNYYQRKSAFLEEWSERRRRQATDLLAGLEETGEDVMRTIADYMHELARINADQRTETIALVGPSIRTTGGLSNPPLADALLPYLEAAKDRRELTDATDVTLVAFLLASGYVAHLAAWVAADPAPFDLRARLDGMVEIVFRGVLTDR